PERGEGSDLSLRFLCVGEFPPILPTCGRLSFPHKEGRKKTRPLPFSPSLRLRGVGGRGRGMEGLPRLKSVTRSRGATRQKRDPGAMRNPASVIRRETSHAKKAVLAGKSLSGSAPGGRGPARQ